MHTKSSPCEFKYYGSEQGEPLCIPAVKAATGELIDVVPPRGHTPDWEDGFRSATKLVADTLWEEYVLRGTGQIESRLRDAFQVAGAK